MPVDVIDQLVWRQRNFEAFLFLKTPFFMGYTKKSDVYPVQSSSTRKTDPVCKFSRIFPDLPNSFCWRLDYKECVAYFVISIKGNTKVTHAFPTPTWIIDLELI